MSKYTVLGIVTLLWFLLPFGFMFVGITSFTYIEVSEFTNIDSPSTVNFVFIFINWMAFFFRVLTFSLPGAPVLIKIFLLTLVPITLLAIISVFRGDAH